MTSDQSMAVIPGRPTGSAASMAETARRLLGLLDESQRARACFPFPSDEARTTWFYTPTDHGGLLLTDCGPGQRQAALRLLATGLSPAGYNLATAVMSHELVLERIEDWPAAPGWGRVRDPLRYAISVFGDPGEDVWAWRFAGHHLSLHYTVVDGALVSATPSFIGADPAQSPLPGGQSLRPCAALEDLGRDLVRSLAPEQFSLALVTDQAPPDIITTNRTVLTDGSWLRKASDLFRDAESFPGHPIIDHLEARHQADEHALDPVSVRALRWHHTPVGLSGAAMDPAHRQLLFAVIGAYLDRLPDDVAGHEQARIARTQPDDLYFAWAGSTEPRRPHYYRIQGPRLLVEYDNSQRDANHIHTVWRDPAADFGADALAAHYATQH
jgi:hypothetical protein